MKLHSDVLTVNNSKDGIFDCRGAALVQGVIKCTKFKYLILNLKPHNTIKHNTIKIY